VSAVKKLAGLSNSESFGRYSYLIDQLNKFAAECPDEIAFVSQKRSTSWKEFKAKVDLFLTSLKGYSHSRALLMLDGRSVDDLALLVASSAVLKQAILLSSFHNKERSIEILHQFNAHFILCIQNGRVQEMADNLEAESRTIGDEFIVGLLTSGTTGNPKCVQHDWERLALAVRTKERYRGRRWLMGYHITNFAGTQVFLQCFMNGGCMVLPSDSPPGASLDAEMITENDVDYLNCTATYARRLLLTMPPGVVGSLKHITLGGEIVDQSVIDSLKKKFPNAKISHIYASTELGSSIEVRDEREGFPLKLIDNVNLKIIDGELHLRPSGRAMIGYLDQADGHSTASFKLPVEGETSWVPTGDLIEVKDNRALFLGRKDLVVNVGGFKVNPFTVEAVIREIDGVHEVLITAQKSPIVGNLLKAVVVARPGRDTQDLKMQILNHCKKRLPYYSVPRLFELTEQLKYTTSNKIKR